MKEIYGNLWDFYGREGYIVCITTNGFVKNDGTAVMGRGSALEAKQRFPWLPKTLGDSIRAHGNVVRIIVTEPDESDGILIFPVKHNWWEMGSKELILASAHCLFDIASKSMDVTYILGRPGCNNGRLEWNGEEGVRNLISFLPDNVHIITRKVII